MPAPVDSISNDSDSDEVDAPDGINVPEVFWFRAGVMLTRPWRVVCLSAVMSALGQTEKTARDQGAAALPSTSDILTRQASSSGFSCPDELSSSSTGPVRSIKERVKAEVPDHRVNELCLAWACVARLYCLPPQACCRELSVPMWASALAAGCFCGGHYRSAVGGHIGLGYYVGVCVVASAQCMTARI
jgi:hypothetical protein